MTGMKPSNVVQVWVDETNASIHIMDYGVGMDENDINTAKKIAVSPKLARTTEFAGFRGLGIWSGLSACEELILTTTKVGVPFAYKLTINCKEIVQHIEDPISIDELLKDRFSIEESEYDENEHFTQVKLVNVDRGRYAELLNVDEVRCYAEQNLPVPFDPAWDYKEAVEQILSDVPWATNYDLTVNDDPVYRQFPPKLDPNNKSPLLKAPKKVIIEDENHKQVAVAWVCETDRRGPKKTIEVTDKPWVRGFAVRVKNLTIGMRGLYSQDVTDVGNLDWYVGEIYITDSDIRPDTKRTHFQPSLHHDAVLKALKQFYGKTALRARAWSTQVSLENKCVEAQEIVSQIETLLTSKDEDENKEAERLRQVQSSLNQLSELEKAIADQRTQANKADGQNDVERTLIERDYLRKPEVKATIDATLGKISVVKKQVAQDTAIQGLMPVTPITNVSKRKSQARTANLQGAKVNPLSVLNSQATTGALPGLDSVLASKDPPKQVSISLDVAMEVFKASIAAVLGEGSENYKRIVDRLPEEMRRRGIDV